MDGCLGGCLYSVCMVVIVEPICYIACLKSRVFECIRSFCFTEGFLTS